MRPVIIETLNNHFHSALFRWLIPNSKSIYICAFVVVLIIFINRSSKIGLSKSYAFWSGVWAIAFGLIGARVYYLLQHIDSVIQSPSQILSISGSTGSFGGYIGGTLGFVLSLKLYKERVLKYMDVAASGFGLGITICRLGCFLAGCCFGKISLLPWAVRFPKGSLPYNAQLSEGLIIPEAQVSLPIHPVQIYSAINGLILFGLASWYWPKLRHRLGATFSLFWLSWCVTRFALEFFRGDKIREFIGFLSTPQFFCLLFIPSLLFGLWCFLRRVNIEKAKGDVK